MKKALTLSIIIPVYNEEHHLPACLNAIAKQTVKPSEVIVVDNNSTDSSVEIAKRYPFVRVIHEPVQGRGAARNAGFNAATSDIIGRIDADSVVAQNWVERVLYSFAHDEKLVGLTGLGEAATLPRLRLRTIIWTWLYFQWTLAAYGVETLWGANMAIRQSAWPTVSKDTVLEDKNVHEDQDLSLLLSAQGFKIARDNNLRIVTNGQSYNYFPKLFHYTVMRLKTKRHHRQIGSLTSIKQTYSLARRLMTYVLLVVPGVAFYAVSFIMWPIDAVAQRLWQSKVWLD